MGLRGDPVPMMEITFPAMLRQGRRPGCRSLHCEWFERGARCKRLAFGKTNSQLGH